MFSFPIDSELPQAIKDAFLSDFKPNRSVAFGKADRLSNFELGKSVEHYRHRPKDDNDERVDHNLDIVFYSADKPMHWEYVRSLFKIEPNAITMMHIPANKVVPEHSDNVAYQRQSAVVYPLSPAPEHYAPCLSVAQIKSDGSVGADPIPYSSCYAFDTKQRHSVINNEFERFAVQIWFDIDLPDLHFIYGNGDLLN